ncbi:hypothetical protein [Prolixibacter sp. NT017]|uniref:hypothetical protein n=1 Tax=Prolixibacter sp. NT017 TaxID=2652390 RepID=UPI001286F0A1|nr:hypothetical protein [Prolixibacter sp. NT017]GET25066.1 hypothetical protein NT017_13950 [Prolixibacter sp. NT017]
MTNLDLLILEDNDQDFDSIHKANFEVFNRLNPEINFIFEGNRAKKIEEAFDLLASDKNFYAAIVDLKVTNEKADDAKGNELIEKIYKKNRIPIFVYSNNLPLLEEKYKDNQSQLLKAYNKADKPFSEILKEISSLYSLGFIDILGKRGQIDSFLNKIFWNHFAKNLEKWESHEGTKEEREKVLIRYISEHLKEHMELKKGSDPFEHYVPEEAYIIPSIKEFVFTGSIVKKEDFFYLVLNPACDFANNKTDYILISKIDPKASLLTSSIKKYNKIGNSKEDKEKAQNRLYSLISNSCSPRYYFLPKANSFQGGLIDFQKIETVKRKVFINEYKAIGTVTSSFMKDITAKFSYYLSRQGSPDFDLDKIFSSLKQEE